MHRFDIATLQHAGRSATAYMPDQRPAAVMRLMIASLAALSILAACTMMLFAIA